MSQKGFKNLESVKDDTSTLVDEDDENNAPATVMYMPEEGAFSNDSMTLFDGQAGLSSNMMLNKQKKRGLNASVQQLHYNENKISLDRSINQTIELLYELSTENKERPIFYPTDAEDDSSLLLNSARAHLALVRNNLSASSKTLSKAKISDDIGENDSVPEFKVLKLNIKMGHNQNNDNLASTLDKNSLAALLEQKLHQQIKYLLNLKDRVDDTSSKVFVTGDLNAGKSTFCNALLRRKVLPEDQQPCTSVFCEVIDATKENKGIEEVHAVCIGNDYNIRDESSYEIHGVNELEDLVYECDKYKLLKVYVLDHRSVTESLLRNGVIDIKLIDAPGLNMDLYQTTQVFSRQEEIDLVVFVVNSENHFTLSAKEFIAAAAAEKRYVFIVVNKFDNINDKDKCMSKILEQIKNLSPDTYKNAKDFVHFVSSTEILNGSPDGGDGGDGDDGDDNNNNNHNNPDFDNLEASLRKFILDKRAISKLLPAKSYLINLLNDLHSLSEINERIYLQEKKDKQIELNNLIAPKYEEIMQKSIKINDSINSLVEKTCTDIYDLTKNEIVTTVNEFGDHQVVPYQGIQYIYEYAMETQRVMIETILSAVSNSESQAKNITSSKVEEIIKFGKTTLGDEFLHDKVFKSELMFTRRRDTIKKKLDDLIEFSDFFDPSWDSCLMWLGVPKEFASSAKQFSVYNSSNLINSAISIKDQLPTQLTLRTLYSSTKLLTTGALIRKLYSLSHLVNFSVIKKLGGPIILGVSGFAIYYLVNDIPNAFPRKQARKIRKHILEMDYPHVNADRISKECRQVLNYPSRQVMNNFQTSIDKRLGEKENLEKCINDAELSSGYFKDLLNKIDYQKKLVNEIDLESLNTVD